MISVPLIAALIGVAPNGSLRVEDEDARRSATQVPATSAPEPAASSSAGDRTKAKRSIYRVSPIADGAVIAAGVLGIVLPYSLSASLITPRCPCDPNEVNSFDRRSIGNSSDAADVISLLTTALALGGPPLLDFLDVGSTPAFLEDMTVFAEALAVNGALVTLAKYVTRRPLPRLYAQQAPDLINSPGGYRSFYSGHTSTTFAALSVAAMSWGFRHGHSVWPWVITLLVGASVAVERVVAGYHFPTDVMVGAVVGMALGIAVPWLHARREAQAGALSFLPRADGAGIAWTVRW